MTARPAMSDSMTTITWESDATHVAIYRNGRIAIIGRKFADFIKIANEAMTGLVRVPDPEGGDPFEWVDHRQLLLLASAASKLAADSYVDAV